jgi:predicted CXXCH cytochrome family protein
VGGKRPHSPRERSARRRRLLRIGALVVLVVAIIAVTGTAYALDRENHDSFCASCHTEPEVTYFQQSLAQDPATLAAFHAQKAVRCIDCHSAGGPFGRITGLEQGAHDLFTYKAGRFHSPAITTNPLGDSSCTKCHGDVAANRTFNNHFHVFLARWEQVDPNAAGCVDCHTSHLSGDPNQGYLDEATVTPICQACHRAVGEG